MSQRLTTGMREQIAGAVLRHRFTDDVEALVKARADFASDVYDDVYRKADREKMAALPDGWLPEATQVCAKFGENDRFYASIPFDGGFHGSLLKLRKKADRSKSVSRRALEKNRHGCWKAYPADHRLVARYSTLHARYENLERSVREAEAQLDAALASAATTAALLKAWPELEPFVNALVPAAVKLPAIPVKSLNAVFKLPVSEAA